MDAKLNVTNGELNVEMV